MESLQRQMTNVRIRNTGRMGKWMWLECQREPESRSQQLSTKRQKTDTTSFRLYIHLGMTGRVMVNIYVTRLHEYWSPWLLYVHAN